MSKTHISFFIPTTVVLTKPNKGIVNPHALEEVPRQTIEQKSGAQLYHNDFVAGWTLKTALGKPTCVKLPGQEIWIEIQGNYLVTLLQQTEPFSFSTTPLKLMRVFYPDHDCWELVSENTLNSIREDAEAIERFAENFVSIEELSINDVILFQGQKILLTAVNQYLTAGLVNYTVRGTVQGTLRSYAFPRHTQLNTYNLQNTWYRYEKAENNFLQFIPYLQLFKVPATPWYLDEHGNTAPENQNSILQTLRGANSAIVDLPPSQHRAFTVYRAALMLKAITPLWSAITEEALNLYFQKHKTLAIGDMDAKVVMYGKPALGLKMVQFYVEISRSRKKGCFTLKYDTSSKMYQHLYDGATPEHLSLSELVAFIQAIAENCALLLTSSSSMRQAFINQKLQHLLE